MKKLLSTKIFPTVILLLVTIGLILAVKYNTGTQISSGYEEFSGFYFDTYISVKLYYDKSDKYIDFANKEGITETQYFKNVFNHIEEICSKYHALTNRFDSSSDVALINTKRSTDIAPETYNIIKKSIEYSELTNGNFDITLGTVTRGFSAQDKLIYDDKTTLSLLKDISYNNVHSDSTTISLKGDNTFIDLGGIVKGYVADEICDYISSKGINNALINLGGNIVTLGTKKSSAIKNDLKNTYFTIGIQKPFAPTGEDIACVKATGKKTAVVTSGIYERYFEKDGKIYHHIFNPKTGKPVENDLYSVTIVSDNSTLADCLSTAIFVMGIQDGMILINSLENTECIFIDKDYKITYSDGLIYENNTFSLISE